MGLSRFEDIEEALRERTNFELRTPPKSGFHQGRMLALVSALGRPERAYRVVHVGGTCGKGTTTAALASCLDAAGLRVGWTTSPHLISLRERIRIGASPAPDALWLEAAGAVLAAANGLTEEPTYFELVIAMAFVTFQRAEVDVAVVEVGLGGRLDATNVVSPAVSVITRIGLDHVELLGHDVSSIAAEKAGIIKAGVPVVAGPEGAEAQAVIEERAAELDAPLFLLDRDLRVDVSHDDGRECAARIETPWGSQAARARLSGPVARNLGLVAGALGVLDSTLLAHLDDGLSRLRWRGRFDVVDRAVFNPDDDPSFEEGQPIVVDGAHDAVSVKALVERYGRRFGSPAPVVLLGMLHDKRVDAVLDLLAPLCAEAVCCQVPSPRSAAGDELARGFRERGREARTADGDAFGSAYHRANLLGVPLVVTGSLYLAGEVLARLGQDVGAAWQAI